MHQLQLMAHSMVPATMWNQCCGRLGLSCITVPTTPTPSLLFLLLFYFHSFIPNLQGLLSFRVPPASDVFQI